MLDRFLSLEGKLAALLIGAAMGAFGLGYGMGQAELAPIIAWPAAAILLVSLAMVCARSVAAPVAQLMRALSGAVQSFRDGDFAFSVHSKRRDEFGELVASHNELGRVLRDERQDLFQRELLLHTVVQNNPTALVLSNSRGHIVHANLAARHLLGAGRKLEGQLFSDLLVNVPEELSKIIKARNTGLASLSIDGQDETYHVDYREFQLNGQRHHMHLFKHLTRELNRQEVATWKKVIRVISHELNNSLAPVISLSHSGQALVEAEQYQRLPQILQTIAERARHLEGFVKSYAGFAKLPLPRIEAVEWDEFLADLARQWSFVRLGELPASPGQFDRVQVEQVLINLLKNAHESGSPSNQVALQVHERNRHWHIDVLDRGGGMSPAVLENALIPFYSTKRSGSGIGLALAREVAEAHGGRLSLNNRPDGGTMVTLQLPLLAQDISEKAF